MFVKDEITKIHYFQLGKLVKTNKKFRKAVLYILDLNESDYSAESMAQFNKEYEIFIKNIFNIMFFLCPAAGTGCSDFYAVDHIFHKRKE